MIAVTGADRPLGYGPLSALPGLRRVLDALPSGRLLAEGGLLPGGPLAAAAARISDAFGTRPGAVIGPAWYGYATAASLTPCAAWRCGRCPRMIPRLARLREQTPPAERDESGTDGLPAFGYLDGDALLAVACLGVWHEMPTLGVLTHPYHRGRGRARAVVARAAQAALDRRAVVQYRAWRANVTSITVARRTGFVHYCDGLVVNLAEPPGG